MEVAIGKNARTPPSGVQSTPFRCRIDLSTLDRPQTPSSGVNAIFGRWPGDEPEPEVDEFFRELS